MNLKNLLDMKRYLNCKFEEGVYIELLASLERNKESIINYSLSYDDNQKKYNLLIAIDDFEKETAKSVFFRILQFAGYSNSMFVRNLLNDRIIYYLLSSSGNHHGYFAEIAFVDREHKSEVVIDPIQLRTQEIVKDSFNNRVNR